MNSYFWDKAEKNKDKFIFLAPQNYILKKKELTDKVYVVEVVNKELNEVLTAKDIDSFLLTVEEAKSAYYLYLDNFLAMAITEEQVVNARRLLKEVLQD